MNTNNCGCKDITPCIQPLCIPTPCACPVLITSDCVNNVTIDLPCLNITKGKTLNAFLLAMDTAICAKFLAVQAYFRLISVGVGVGKIYKGINILGEKEIKSIKSGNLITVANLTNEVEIGVDQTAFNALIPNVTASNVGTGLGEVFKNKVLNVLNFRKIKTENTGATGASVLKVEVTDLINDNVVISARKIKTDNSGTTGESILKTEIENTNDITISAKKINSESLMISTSVDTNTLNIEVIDSGIPQYIVNSDYTGFVEKGTIAKPYKNLQNALNAFVGTGAFTNKNPQNVGVQITVQKDSNIFTGSLAYRHLRLKIESTAQIVSNPSFGDFLMDVDSNAILPTGMIPFTDTDELDVSITLEGAIILFKQGFKNRGTLLNGGLSRGKIIRMTGAGGIGIKEETNTASPSLRSIFEGNRTNLPGYFNDGNVANFGIQTNFTTQNTKLAYIGLGCRLHIANSTQIQATTPASFPINTNTKPIEINGGELFISNSTILFYGVVGVFYESFISVSNTSNIIILNTEIKGQVNNFIKNEDATQSAITLNNVVANLDIFQNTIKSLLVLLVNVKLINCYFPIGNVDPLQVKFLPNTLNIIKNQVVETLSEYSNRANAVANGLFKGCKFINTGGVVSPTTGWFIDIIV